MNLCFALFYIKMLANDIGHLIQTQIHIYITLCIMQKIEVYNFELTRKQH